MNRAVSQRNSEYIVKNMRILYQLEQTYRRYSSSVGSDVVVRAKNVSFSYIDSKWILDDISFSVRQGSKVTIMGQNGVGKSTIIKLIQGVLKPTLGTISITNNLSVATAQQALSLEDYKSTVYNFFKKNLQGNDKGIDSRLAKVFQRINLNPPLDRCLNTFSGGQQARLLLGAALIQEPDILLLDEPTNNLDTKGVDLLTDFIQSTENTCIVISHDEDFLNSFTDAVLYLDHWAKKVEFYQGNYHDVKMEIADRIRKENSDNARLEKLAQQKKDQANQFANKGGNMRKVAKKLRETADALEADKVTVRKEDKALRPFVIPLQTNIKDAASSKLVEIKTLVVPYPGLVNSRGQQLSSARSSDTSEKKKKNDITHQGSVVELHSPIVLRRKSNLHLRGPNGIGKSTFLNSIANRTNSGCKVADGITIGYYRQDFAHLNFNQTVLECLWEAGNGIISEQDIRGTAAAFLISRHQIDQKIGTLSEGQKGLLSFVRIMLQKPGLLIVDEPTNHINFRHLPAIAAALKSFEGATIFVSHDQQFIKQMKVQDELDLGMYLK